MNRLLRRCARVVNEGAGRGSARNEGAGRGSARNEGSGRGSARNEGCGRGSAIIEFVFVALVVMVPLVYLIVAVAVLQQSQLAVAQAAREAGRAFATSPGRSATPGRVDAAVRLALAGQGLPDDVAVRFVAAGSSCASAAVDPRLDAGAQFTVCVTRRVVLPAVPSVLAGRGITAVGRYTVHVDDYRTVAP